MTVRVACPRCKQTIEVRPTDGDGPVRCPGCQAAIVLKRRPPSTPNADPKSDQHQVRPAASTPAEEDADSPSKYRLIEEAEDDDRPRKRRFDDDAEEDERPRRRRRVFDDEDAPPKRRRQVDDDRADIRSRRRWDEDDDDRPRRRREDSVDDDEPLPRRRRQKSGTPWLLIVLLGGGGFLLLSLIIAMVILLGSLGHSRSFRLDQGQTMFWNITFKQNYKVEIWVSSTGQSDIDLHVIDAQGRVVAFDDGDSKDCYVMFVAQQPQPYKVEVRNMQRIDQPWRNGFNRGTLRHTETFVNNPPVK